MHLYEINAEIALLLHQLEVDPETGEILASSEEIIRQLDALGMERHRILEYLAKVVIDARATMTALKVEEDRLADRRRRMERREERLMQVLDRECGGVKTDLGVATLSYRKTTRVDVQDNTRAIDWLRQNSHLNCIRTKDPEVDKSAVRRLLSNGTQIPGIELVTSQSCSLR